MKKHLNKTKIRHTKTIQKVKKILQKTHQEKTFKNKYYKPTTQHPKTITLETNLSPNTTNSNSYESHYEQTPNPNHKYDY